MRLRLAPAALLATTVLAILLPAGCAKKDSVTNPRTGPTANFSGAPLSGVAPADVDFTNHSVAGTSAITSVLWDFGDGQTSTATSASHLYSSPGSYTVKLTVATADGSDTQTRADYILITDSQGGTVPTAAFSGTPTGGNAPLTVQFTDASTPGSSSITGRSWDFGDGTAVSTATNPSHTYTTNGSYTVSLTVTNSVGPDTETKPAYIVVQPAPVPPTAQFSGTPTDGHVPLTVQFTDQSAPGSAPITSRSWNFGDGTAVSTATNPSHVYTTAGSYTVSLTVTTTAGSDSEVKTAYVNATPTPVPPTAQFSGTPTAGPTPLLVQFTDQSTPGTSPITAWAWTFGDGGTSASQSPSHTYSAVGSYTVALKVTTADGQNTNTKTSYIQPCQAPAADFVGVPTTGIAPLPVVFTDLSTGAPTTRNWSFGDGGTSTATNPSHTYQLPGTYTVTLRAGNACGTDSTTKVGYITVADGCPNPIYTVSAASWSNITDTDGDGYRTRARLNWTTLVSTGCTKSVFARIYSRPMGDSTWTLLASSACYTVTGGKNTTFNMFLQPSLPMNCYQFRIDVLECGGTEAKATRGPADDVDLNNQCWEP